MTHLIFAKQVACSLGILLVFAGLLPAYEQKRTPTWTPAGLPGIEVRVHTGSPYHHLMVGHEDQLAWVIRNDGPSDRKLELVYSIEAYDGTKREDRFSFAIGTGEEHRQPIARPILGKRGVKWVTFHLRSSDHKTAEQKVSFVYFEPAGPTKGRQRGDFLLSTGYGGGPEPFNEENQELIALAGFKAARFNPGWGRIQPQKNIWNWDHLDEAVANHLKYGLEPQFLIYGTPRWAVNEKEVQFHDDPKVRARQEHAILRDGKPFFDFYGHHRHGEFRFFTEEIPLVQALMQKYGVEQPIFFTETAMDSRFGERHQAETLIKKAVHSWSLGAVGYTWFNVHDTYNPAKKHGEWYGLYTFTGYPKAAYAAHATLARNLLNLNFKHRYDFDEDCFYAYAFAGEGRVVLVAWNEDPAVASPHLVLKTAATKVEKIDVMGNSETLTLKDGMVPLLLEDMPFFYVFHGTGETPEIAGAIRLSRSSPFG